ncbi:hypothetical protein ABII15_35525 [Streptomyces sp. HUAS MG91]|uniref:Uncharacterized protein n=1 Tax=Streptomyces tabacisoli TaxID=3156398 RepID=A0AAU8J2C8_9ACTN
MGFDFRPVHPLVRTPIVVQDPPQGLYLGSAVHRSSWLLVLVHDIRPIIGTRGRYSSEMKICPPGGTVLAPFTGIAEQRLHGALTQDDFEHGPQKSNAKQRSRATPTDLIRGRP